MKNIPGVAGLKNIYDEKYIRLAVYVSNTCYQVSGTKYLVPGTWYRQKYNKCLVNACMHTYMHIYIYIYIPCSAVLCCAVLYEPGHTCHLYMYIYIYMHI